MKKWTYLVGGIVIGAIVATSGSAFAAQVKSMIGLKVTGEYTVVVNGETLQDKGAAIAGRANVPVRAIAGALGADIKVEGKVITVTTAEPVDPAEESGQEENAPSNAYERYTKASLVELKDSLENRILKPTINGREEIIADMEIMKAAYDKADTSKHEKQLALYDADIAKYTEELRLVNEALAALEAQQ